MSPLVFSQFISGLESELVKNKTGTTLGNRPIDLLMYADDITLMSSSEEGLRKHLRPLEEFCDQWKLMVNIAKTKVCAFGKKPTPLSLFSFKSNDLEMVQAYKYLGVWMILYMYMRFQSGLMQIGLTTFNVTTHMGQVCREILPNFWFSMGLLHGITPL